MRKWLILILLLIPLTATASIKIHDLEVIDNTEVAVMLGNMAAAIAKSLADESILVTVCVSDGIEEVCCTYIEGEANYNFNIYLGGE